MKKYHVSVRGMADQVVYADSIASNLQGVAFFVKDRPEAIVTFFAPHIISLRLVAQEQTHA